MTRGAAALPLLLAALTVEAQPAEQPPQPAPPQQQDPGQPVPGAAPASPASPTPTAPAAQPAPTTAAQATAAPPQTQPQPAPPAAGTAPQQQTAAPPAATQPPQRTAQVTLPPTTTPPPATAGATGPTSGQAPPDQAARALSRTLVEQGGLLIEPGKFEIVPEVGFALSDQDEMLTADGTVVDAQTRRVTGSLTLRLGLPLRLQAEGELPLVWARQNAVSNGPPAATETGLGDIRGELTFQAYRSTGRAPDVLLDGFWKTRTGRTLLDVTDPALVPLGTGTQQAGGGISLVKAVDPVVLLGSVSLGYGIPRRLHQGWLATGPELGITTSAVLAVSPETSLSFGLEQSYSGDVTLAGKSLPNTGHTAAVFDVGFATLVSRAGLLQITLGIGLTSDVPRFSVSMGLPLAF